MRRLLAVLALGYVALALIYRASEAAGMIECACDSDCWCRRPGISVFRWVFPRFHRNPELEAWKKRRFEIPE